MVAGTYLISQGSALICLLSALTVAATTPTNLKATTPARTTNLPITTTVHGNSTLSGTLGSLIQDDGTIRPFNDQTYCLVHYATTRRSRFTWENCEKARNSSAFTKFVYDPITSDYGQIKTVEDDKCMFIERLESMRVNPKIGMRHCDDSHDSRVKLQWEIKDHGLWFRHGQGEFCVPFEADSVARLRRCRWNVLAGNKIQGVFPNVLPTQIYGYF